MRIRTASLLFVVAAGLLFGCKKSDSVVGPDACQLTSTRAQAFSDALTTYSKTPTAANCTAFKTAGSAYLDAAASCTTVNQADLTNARKELNDIKC
jgi:hypothetical protein